jgi:hypothetical protein
LQLQLSNNKNEMFLAASSNKAANFNNNFKIALTADRITAGLL